MHVHSTFYEVRTLHFSYSSIGIYARQYSICANTARRKTVQRRLHNIADTASDPRSSRSLGDPKLELEVSAKPQRVGVAALDCSVSSFHKGTERMVYHTLAHPAPRVGHQSNLKDFHPPKASGLLGHKLKIYKLIMILAQTYN